MATKVQNLFNANGEMLYPLTHVKAVVNDSGENVEQLLEAQNEKIETQNKKIGDWENSDNDSILDEIGEHYAEEGDSDYDKGLWGHMKDTRRRLSALEQNGQIKLIKMVTYAELKAMRDNGELVGGHLYRITDYVTTTVQSQTKSAGHPFDVIVLAISHNELSHIARAIAHEGDTYFDGNDLGAWELWYDLDNNTEKYTWADAENGKGVIYRMIDEKRNDCPYDFKNILFFNDKLTTDTTADKYYYTFSYVVSSVLYDGTVEKRVTSCYGNSIGVYILGKKKTLNSNVWQNSYFGHGCSNNTLENGCHTNTFGYNCSNNTFKDNCYGNTLENGCNNNTFGYNSTYNTLGSACNNNILRSNCHNNTFGYNCRGNTFKVNCASNTLGNHCASNTINDGCHTNTFGNNCYDNTLWKNCKYNTLGENIQRREIDGSNTSIASTDEYYDDGSGNIVPMKYPNLSTQPNILPYKVGGSYVYEQLICLSEARCGDDADYTDKVSCEIPWTAEVENPRILSASFFTSCSEYPNANIPVIAHYYGGRIIALVDRIALARAHSLPLEDGTMPTGWLRIVYSEFRDMGSNYYYSYQMEEKLGELHIVYDTENYDSSLALALYTGQVNDYGIPIYGDIISKCDADVPKGVRLHGDYLRKFLYEGLTLALLADSTIYGLCKGTTCVECGNGEPFVYGVSYPGPFANLYGLYLDYELSHGETVVLRINHPYS